MVILGLEKMSLVDFDGLVAATVFTGGCNFRCDFCHNSPLVLSHDKLPALDEDEVLSYLKKRRVVLDGVCVSGGEPTLQKDLPEFLIKLKNIGYKVKLDTNGTAPELIKNLYADKLVDYFAMDIKNDRENYAKIIGFNSYDTANVEKSVEFLLSLNGCYEFRTTIIDEFHDEQNITNIGKWIEGADKYFLQKFKSNENCINSSLSPVPDDKAKKFLLILKNYLSSVNLRGYD
jgi:pyruvate formate lyase activating enzyme